MFDKAFFYSKMLYSSKTIIYKTKGKTMQNQLPDVTAVVLHFADIQEIDDTLTNDEARQVLQLIQNAGTSAVDIKAWIKYFYSI